MRDQPGYEELLNDALGSNHRRTREKNRIELKLICRDDLQIAEERVARRVAAGEDYRNPSEERRERNEQYAQ
jgi:hypothetical protein